MIDNGKIEKGPCGLGANSRIQALEFRSVGRGGTISLSVLPAASDSWKETPSKKVKLLRYGSPIGNCPRRDNVVFSPPKKENSERPDARAVGAQTSAPKGKKARTKHRPEEAKPKRREGVQPRDAH
jgi:hypothetical protein